MSMVFWSPSVLESILPPAPWTRKRKISRQTKRSVMRMAFTPRSSRPGMRKYTMRATAMYTNALIPGHVSNNLRVVMFWSDSQRGERRNKIWPQVRYMMFCWWWLPSVLKAKATVSQAAPIMTTQQNLCEILETDGSYMLLMHLPSWTEWPGRDERGWSCQIAHRMQDWLQN